MFNVQCSMARWNENVCINANVRLRKMDPWQLGVYQSHCRKGLRLTKH
jgi:hypothetical protein